MATVAKVVARALRLIGVNDPSEDPSADDFETAMDAMNAMCTRWEADGLAIGWQNVSNPSDEMPSPAEADEPIVYQLAVRIAPEYGVMPSALVIGGATSFLNSLRRDRLVANPIYQCPNVPMAYAGRGGYYSIKTDTF